MYSPQELEEAGLTDFRVFLCETWAFLNLPKPTRIQLSIARWLQRAPRRVILMAFRGVGKSWLTAAFVCWCLLLNPELKIMVVSANQNLADDFSKFVKQLISGMPVLQHLTPGPGQRDSAISFDVGPARPSKDPSVKSVGITGQLTGSRADIIIADDVEVPKNTQTHLMRERLATLVKEFDAVLKPGGRVIYLGTPQCEASLYNRLETRGYVCRIWPSEVPKSSAPYRGRLAPIIEKLIESGVAPHTPVDAERFSRADLDERLASYGHNDYALQFLLDTTPSDADTHPLKLRDLMVLDCDRKMGHVQLAWGGARELVLNDLAAGGYDGDCYVRPAFMSPQMANYAQIVMAIDPSGKGRDETAFAIVAYMHGMLYLLESGGFKDGFAESTLKALASRALVWGVQDVIIETNYGGGMFNQLLKPWLVRVFADANEGARGAAGRIDDEYKGWSSGQKEMRILDTLEPIVQSHRLVVNRAVIENDAVQQQENPHYSLVYQYTRMARIRGAVAHDDRIEALAMACGYFTEKMNRDQRKALQQHKDELQKKELESFARHVFGIKKPRRTNWVGRW